MADADAESVAAAEAAARVHAALTGPGGPFAVVRAEDGPQAGSLVYADGPRTLREFVETTWAFGDRPFLIAGVAGVAGITGAAGERSYAYGEFFAAASALACRLSDVYGLRPGDRAVVAMRNRPEWQIAFWAAQLAGLVAVPLDPRWTEAEFTYALDDSAPRVLLVDGERLPPVADWARKAGARVIVFHGEDHPRAQEDRVERYEDLPAPDPLAAPPDVEVRPEDDATILYTPGVTGRPQGVVATQLAQAGAARNPRFHAAASALARGAVPGQEPAPVTLLTFPFFHVAALSVLYAAMSAGGSVVLMGEWDVREALRLIREHRVTNYAGTPETALDLLAEADRTGDRPASLRTLDTGGSVPSHALIARLAAGHGQRIEPHNGYGPAGTGGGVLANTGAEYRLHPGSAGRPTPSTEVRIAGPAGEALPDGETGELWLRGQALARGYWQDEEATAQAFSGGWFRTGDLAVIRDGRVDPVGRAAGAAAGARVVTGG